MKVIFIDIDGPLAWGTWGDGKVKISEGHWHELIIPYPWVEEDCKALSKIVEETGASLVVSSDWKLHYGLGQLKMIFKYYNIPTHSVIDTTPGYNPKMKMSSSSEWNRACQILYWVKTFKPSNWISIDDMELDQEYKWMRPRVPMWRHVQVNGDFGSGGRLRDKIYECIKKLNRGSNEGK